MFVCPVLNINNSPLNVCVKSLVRVTNGNYANYSIVKQCEMLLYSVSKAIFRHKILFVLEQKSCYEMHRWL